MKKLASLVIISLALFLIAACGSDSTAVPAGQTASTVALNKISVSLDWFPWANHSGLYIALDKGYFADEGLDVEIHPPADPSAVLQTVAAGRDDFGINYQTGVLIAREQDIHVSMIV